MLRDKFLVIVSFSVLHIFSGCATPVVKSELDQLYEKNFEGFGMPEITEIRNERISKSFPYTTFDEVWDAVILVLMQHGAIAHAAKDNGVVAVITTPPMVVFVEKGDTVTVYLRWMDKLYRRLDKPALATVKFDSYIKRKFADNVFDTLSTQIYAKGKWKYLFTNTPQL